MVFLRIWTKALASCVYICTKRQEYPSFDHVFVSMPLSEWGSVLVPASMLTRKAFTHGPSIFPHAIEASSEQVHVL
jgi:hypothetical protein